MNKMLERGNKRIPISIIYPTEGTMLNVDGIALVNKPHVCTIFNKPFCTTTFEEFDKSIRKDVTETNHSSIENLDHIPLIPQSRVSNIPHHQFLEMIQ